MDTREKIVALDDLRARLGDRKWVAVVGRFDPLTLAQAERLEEAAATGKSVLAVVESGDNCLLPLDARAVLIAALRTVDLVVKGQETALQSYHQLEVLTDEAGERQRSKDFVDFVAKRQGAVST